MKMKFVAGLLVMSLGCSGESVSTSADSAKPEAVSHEVAAELHVVAGRAGPMIVATARIPLEEFATSTYFLAIDGNSLYGDYAENTLPIKPRDGGKYRFGIVSVVVPMEAIGEEVSRQAAGATIKGDVGTLEKIAGSLKGRVSFFHELWSEAYE